jgi:nucleotide-binding universal stress UspA family protein
MRALAAVDTVHTAAAICDYLGDRLDDADEVVAVTVVPEDAASEPTDGATPAPGADADRDGREALNVTSVRLAGIDVSTDQRRGEPAQELLAAAAEHDVDEIVIGARAGVPDVADGVGSTAADGAGSSATDAPESASPTGLGSTATAVLSGADRPVVVLPGAGV